MVVADGWWLGRLRFSKFFFEAVDSLRESGHTLLIGLGTGECQRGYAIVEIERW